ncbi:WhiB family transcriptional regulator [Saccharothrix tamanrassetensis]|uniref:WhiB family transcriptional regulator n=1 Tax=Saccharothrix tamanrassetensis TaxID=1051531 RepID=UPI00161DD22F|nr:WhiB family transcriptional regulator [Saccharothrix tamanrassetensis]
MLALFGSSGQPPAWRDQAACKGQDPERFFRPSHHGQQDAATVCAGCPVLDRCREDQIGWEARGPAARRYRPTGVVGGLTGRERHAVHYPASGLRKDAA